MSRSKKSSWSLGTIIFWGFLAYMWFGGGDDNDNKEVNIVEQDKPSIQETIKDVGNQLKVSTEIIIKEATAAIQEVQAKKETSDEPPPEPKPEPEEEDETMIAEPEQEKEIIIAEPELEEKKLELKSLNENPKDTGMKKL